jgi:hypothetical protein
VLALQRSAGNHAVTGMLSRAPEPEEKEKTRGVVHIERLASVPIYSYDLVNGPKPGSNGHGTEGRKKEDPMDLRFTSAEGAHSIDLLQAVSAGTHFDSGTIEYGAQRILLTDLILTEYHPGGQVDPAESWAVSARKALFTT